MTYAGFKDLPRRTVSGSVLHDKVFNIAKYPKYDVYPRGIASLVYTFSGKRISAMQANKFAGGAVKSKIRPNQEVAEKLLQPIIKIFEKWKVYSSFKNGIWGADLTDTPSISKSSIGFRFLLCVIDIYSKYAWVVPLKNKKGITFTNAFQKFFKWV